MEQSLVFNENDRRYLECPICKDLFTIPKVTRCSHIFCEDCLKHYLENNNCNAPPCTVCRQGIVLPQNGMQGFQTEHFYQDLIKRLKKKDELVNNMKKGVCGLCQEKSELKSKCLTCACVICKQCLPSHNALKTHCNIVDLSKIDNIDENELLSQNKVVCEIHMNRLANLYCRDCNKVICLLCKISETEHIDHKCDPLDMRGTFCRDELKSLQEKIPKLIEKAIAGSYNVTTIFSDFLRDLQDVENRVTDKIAMAISELMRKQESFLESIEKKRNEFRMRLLRQKHKIEKVKQEGQALLDEVTKVVSYGTDADITTLQDDLKHKVKNLTSELDSSLHKDFRIKVDFNECKLNELKLLLCEYNIGKIKCSQKVVVNICTDSNVSQINELFPSAAPVSNDRFISCYASKHQRDKLFETIMHVGKISYSDDEGTVIKVFKHGSTTIKSNDQIRIIKGLEEVIFQDRSIKILANEKLIKKIYCRDVEGEINDVDTHDQQLLVVGKLNNGKDHCTVFNKKDGTRRFRYMFPSSCSKSSSYPPCGSFTSVGNVILTVEYKGLRELVLLNTSTNKLEELILPSFPNEDAIQLETVCETCEGQLYTTTMYDGKLLTVSYLP